MYECRENFLRHAFVIYYYIGIRIRKISKYETDFKNNNNTDFEWDNLYILIITNSLKIVITIGIRHIM